MDKHIEEKVDKVVEGLVKKMEQRGYKLLMKKISEMKIQKCPNCGSEKTIPILYGLPMLGRGLFMAEKNKDIVLGGCFIIPGMQDDYYCKECNKGFMSEEYKERTIIFRGGKI